MQECFAVTSAQLLTCQVLGFSCCTSDSLDCRLVLPSIYAGSVENEMHIFQSAEELALPLGRKTCCQIIVLGFFADVADLMALSAIRPKDMSFYSVLAV